ncbi:MAG: DinB family protein [Gemmatimonadetes bacterium]|nr:MAG: DinB family protein [Gemmatimonadota bacterium]
MFHTPEWGFYMKTHESTAVLLLILERTAEKWHLLATLVTDSQAKQAAEGEWSLAEVLAHLRACAEVWSHSIVMMVAQSQPELAYIHPNTWMKTCRYAELPFAGAVQAFVIRRQELLYFLRGLDEHQWERTGRIKGREHSVYSQVRRMALHEEKHIIQIERLVTRIREVN